MRDVKTPRTRAYDSSSRRRAAAQRREHVINNAAQLFAERGFEATTLADIAAAGGVSVPYLRKLGSKVDIIEMAIHAVTVGPQHTVEQAFQESVALRDTLDRDKVLDFIAQTTAEWNARSYPLWVAWARSSDPELRDGWKRVMTSIRAGWADWLASFDSLGWWRTDIARREQIASVWILTMAETYERLQGVPGFNHGTYLGWLRRSLADVLVGTG